MKINQNELRSAIARLTEDMPERSTPIYYRNPLQVAQEESRGRANRNSNTASKSDINANRRQPESLNALPSAVIVEESDVESFRQAERHWQLKRTAV